MDLRTFGRNLVEVLAERSLHALRGANMDDLRRVLTGEPVSAHEAGPRAGAALGAFAAGAALGAGLTALYTPTTGTQLRKKLSVSARDARKQARELGSSVRSQIDDARTTIAASVEQASAAVGLTAPPRAKRAAKRATNGSSKASNGRARRTPSATASRAHHA